MANDVSYFKVPGDSTTYSFNDADAENKIGALETTVADQVDSIAANATNIQTNRTAIGTLSSLTTEAQGNLVAAVNEVDSHADANASAISTINTAIGSTALPTTAQTLTGAIAEHEDDISQLNSKFAVAGDVASVQFGVTDTNLQIRFDCGAARGVYFFNIHRGTAQVSLMRTYNGQTTTIWTLT